MRLTPFQRQSILELSHKHFGDNCAAYLFGSRTNNELKGGDIDLLIESDSNRQVDYTKRLAFRSDLKCQIGDQKIDVIFAMPGDVRPIVQEARREMVRL
jgi:predicted nucleotidyltransferase